MSELNCLEFQPIDAEETPAGHKANADNITFNDQLDGEALAASWSKIVEDLRQGSDVIDFTD